MHKSSPNKSERIEEINKLVKSNLSYSKYVFDEALTEIGENEYENISHLINKIKTLRDTITYLQIDLQIIEELQKIKSL